ncbi:MAG: efflux RND transporter permease subunit [Hymenobacter sp.]
MAGQSGGRLLTIPVTVCLHACWCCTCSGITIDIMSLGAIAASVGLIIDDAIVIIEQIYRGHEEDPANSNVRVVRVAIAELFPAMVGLVSERPSSSTFPSG